MFKLAIVFAAVSFVSAGVYDGYKVYRISPQTKDEAYDLMSWQVRPGVDFWSESRMINQPSEVMISPELQNEFEEYLVNGNFTWKVANDNLEGMLQDFERSRKHRAVPRNGEFSFEDYQRHQVMNNYLDKLAKTYPKYVTVKDEGKSFENRVIKSVRITDGTKSKNKVTMVIDCGIHAREWIASAFCMYLIEELTVRREKNLDMLRKVDWFIVPLLNPDGYEYTHTTERLWRKTRRPYPHMPSCKGVDGNRNYAHQWGGAGTSNDPCSDVFRGPEPFSEPETRLMGNLIIAETIAKPGKVGYLTFHSYGYWLLYPWGHSEYVPEPEFAHKLKRATNNVVKAVHKHSGGIYRPGNSAQLLYPAAGGSDDFAMGVGGIELALTVELPPRTVGFQGFLLPPDQILSVCNETMVAVREFGYFLADNYLV